MYPFVLEYAVKEYEIEEQLKQALELLQIKNERIRNWIYKAILESHNQQLEYQKKAVIDLISHLNNKKSMLDNLVDMKAAGEIDKATYDRKKSKYTEEIEKMENTLKKYEKYEDKYIKLGVKFYEISQKAKEVYEILLPEKKRMLLHVIYASITLKDGQIKYIYTKPFQILAKAVEATNSSKIFKNKKLPKNIFEQEEKTTATTQKPLYLSEYSVLRRGWDSNPR